MAVIPCTELDYGDGKRYAWLGATSGDTFAPLIGARLSDKTVDVDGNLGGGTLTIEGHNDEGFALKTLKDPEGNLLSFTAPAIATLLTNPFRIVPKLTGGAGAAVNIIINAVAPK